MDPQVEEPKGRLETLESRFEALAREHGALLGELATLKIEHTNKTKELVVSRAKESILQMEVNMIKKFPKSEHGAIGKNGAQTQKTCSA